MKLSVKLPLLFVLFSIIPLAAVGYLAYDYGRQTIEQDTFDRLVTVNLLKAAEFERWLKGNTQQLRLLANRPQVQQLTAQLAATDTSVVVYQVVSTRLLEDHLKVVLNEDGFVELWLLHPETGRVLLSTNPRQEGQTYRQEPYFVAGRQSTFIQNIQLSPTTGQPVMLIATPVNDEQGHLLVVLAGRLNLAELSHIFKQGSGLHQTEETYLVDKFNRFITVSLLNPNPDLFQTIQTGGVAACLLGQNGVGLYEDYRGVPVMGAYHWLPDRELCILTEIDQAEAFVSITEMGQVILDMGALVALVAASLGLFLAGAINKPLGQLVKGVAAIGQGRLDYRVGLVTNDEIGQLARAFDQMAGQRQQAEAELKRTLDQLEQRVEERTMALRQSEAHLQAILDHSPALISTKDLQGNVTLINKHFEVLAESPAEVFVGKNIYDLFPYEIAHALWQNDLAALAAASPIEAEEVMAHQDGSWRTYLTLKFPIYYPDTSQPFAICAISTDITERKRIEEKLQQLNEELKRSNTELERFASVASHDLQEPLRVVTSFVQLLARRYQGHLDAEANELITYALDGTTRMKRLINDLLAYSRVSTRGRPFAPTDCQVVCALVLVNLQLAIEETQAKVTIDPLPTVMADETQLGQLFQNLIGNALKFHGDKPPEIQIEAKPYANDAPGAAATAWLFSIRDNGIGFEPQFAERIFVIFQRLHGPGHYPGTGIGLAICQKIVERHGGRIWAESQPGQGATFYFTLPFEQRPSNGTQ